MPAAKNQPVLSQRTLNRTLLMRQALLERETIPVWAMTEKLVGVQAQVTNPPYIGLWTRLRGFQRADLTTLLTERRLVRAALMRSTLHLFTIQDFLRFRTTIQPGLIKALGAFFGAAMRELDPAPIIDAVRPFLLEKPRTAGEIKKLLSPRFPDREPEALMYLVRSYLPLVQMPPGGAWSVGGSPAYALLEEWDGVPLDPASNTQALIRRYLAAFGPASIADFQAWAGLVRMKEAFEGMRGELRTYRDSAGVELFDLPDATLAEEDLAAPVRFMPEYDNLILSHSDRTRVIGDDHRAYVYLSAGRVRSTVLVDGFVAGAWKVERAKKAATLIVEPFAPLDSARRSALVAEGETLLRFIEDDATTFDIQFKPV